MTLCRIINFGVLHWRSWWFTDFKTPTKTTNLYILSMLLTKKIPTGCMSEAFKTNFLAMIDYWFWTRPLCHWFCTHWSQTVWAPPTSSVYFRWCMRNAMVTALQRLLPCLETIRTLEPMLMCVSENKRQNINWFPASINETRKYL